MSRPSAISLSTTSYVYVHGKLLSIMITFCGQCLINNCCNFLIRCSTICVLLYSSSALASITNMYLTILVTILCSLKNKRKKRSFESHTPKYLVSEDFAIRKKCVYFNSCVSVSSTFNPSNVTLYSVNSTISFHIDSIIALTSDTIRK